MSIKNLLNRCGSATTKRTKPKIPKIEANEKHDPLAFLDECLGHIEIRVVELNEISKEYKQRGQKNGSGDLGKSGGMNDASIGNIEES